MRPRPPPDWPVGEEHHFHDRDAACPYRTRDDQIGHVFPCPYAVFVLPVVSHDWFDHPAPTTSTPQPPPPLSPLPPTAMPQSTSIPPVPPRPSVVPTVSTLAPIPITDLPSPSPVPATSTKKPIKPRHHDGPCPYRKRDSDPEHVYPCPLATDITVVIHQHSSESNIITIQTDSRAPPITTQPPLPTVAVATDTATERPRPAAITVAPVEPVPIVPTSSPAPVVVVQPASTAHPEVTSIELNTTRTSIHTDVSTVSTVTNINSQSYSTIDFFKAGWWYFLALFLISVLLGMLCCWCGYQCCATWCCFGTHKTGNTHDDSSLIVISEDPMPATLNSIGTHAPYVTVRNTDWCCFVSHFLAPSLATHSQSGTSSASMSSPAMRTSSESSGALHSFEHVHLHVFLHSLAQLVMCWNILASSIAVSSTNDATTSSSTTTSTTTTSYSTTQSDVQFTTFANSAFYKSFAKQPVDADSFVLFFEAMGTDGAHIGFFTHNAAQTSVRDENCYEIVIGACAEVVV